jgi:hypothetical protein
VKGASRPAMTYARLLDLHRERTITEAAPAPLTDAEREALQAAIKVGPKG